MVYLQMVDSKLQKRSLFHFFWGGGAGAGVTLRILQMFANIFSIPACWYKQRVF